MLLGYCTVCGASYESPVVKDAPCVKCQAEDDRYYRNDPTPYVDTDTRQFSKSAMRERLGVTGNEDV